MIITQEIYERAKRHLHKPTDDAEVASRFGFSPSTARKIRNTKNYGEYVTQTKNAHRRAVRRENLAKKQEMLKMADLSEQEPEQKTTSQRVAALAAMIFVLALAGFAVVGVIKFAMWVFGV